MCLLTRLQFSVVSVDATVLCCVHWQTVPALLMGLWCLANTPEAQQTLYREICSALPGGHQQPVTASVVNDMPFMKAVLKETLRWATAIHL